MNDSEYQAEEYRGESFPPVSRRGRLRCRRCLCEFNYPRWYRAHHFHCPVCGWREYLDRRKYLGGQTAYPGGGFAPKLTVDQARRPPIKGGVV